MTKDFDYIKQTYTDLKGACKLTKFSRQWIHGLTIQGVIKPITPFRGKTFYDIKELENVRDRFRN